MKEQEQPHQSKEIGTSEEELQYWSKKLGVTREALEEAITLSESRDPAVIEEYLGSR
jgi:hypothetical protein